MSTAPIAQGSADVNVSRQCTCHPDDKPPTPAAELKRGHAAKVE